jgi:hypothetical protein
MIEQDQLAKTIALKIIADDLFSQWLGVEIIAIKEGYSKILLDFANQHIKSMGFDEARLWCEKELIPFYKKLEWNIEKMSDEKYVMIKSF